MEPNINVNPGETVAAQTNTVQAEVAPQSAPVIQPQVLTVNKRERVVLGILGALLFSLGGVVLYFLIYQLGYIAGIIGLAIYFLAYLGYKLFSGAKVSRKGAIISIFILVLATVFAELVCLGYAMYQEFSPSCTLLEAFSYIPDALTVDEVKSAVIKDVLISLVLGLLASFSTIKQAITAEKAERAAWAAAQQQQQQQ